MNPSLEIIYSRFPRGSIVDPRGGENDKVGFFVGLGGVGIGGIIIRSYSLGRLTERISRAAFIPLLLLRWAASARIVNP